jgi:aerobic-type carbon monoxide dehydrogenase small subunit (CoxS/CutS family)
LFVAPALELSINDTRHRLEVDPTWTLLSVLREELCLTGAKPGCGEGECGACTVLIDDRPRRACQTVVAEAVGKQVTTIEGLERNGELHPLQEAFLELEAFQCGYCTAGMILSGVGLLRVNPQPTDQEIIAFMQGNICRCGVYLRIVAAIRRASAIMMKDHHHGADAGSEHDTFTGEGRLPG